MSAHRSLGIRTVEFLCNGHIMGYVKAEQEPNTKWAPQTSPSRVQGLGLVNRSPDDYRLIYTC